MSRSKTTPVSDAPPLVNTARVCENSPGALEAELLLNGQRRVSPRTTPCRCGHSAHKPYRDGSHKAAGFTTP